MKKIRLSVKPKILKTKIELSELIRKKIKPLDFYKSPIHNYYWQGTYKINDVNYYIYFQRYSRGLRRMQVDYVNIRYSNNHEALKPKEIHNLLELVNSI